MLEFVTNVKAAARQRGDGGNRRCIAEGGCLSREDGIRFVVGPGDEVVPDIFAKLPGRGFWVGARRTLVERAVANNQFQRAARKRVTVPANLSDCIESQLADHCIDLIAMARRAGQAVGGFEKTRSLLLMGRSSFSLQAADATGNARKKFRTFSRDVMVVRVLQAAELGRAFGRERLVYVAIANGGLAQRLCMETKRLNGFRADGGDWD
ncbi:MAG: RNA-binding protein [Pseudomonadota bacterium]|nr:RNA-binding protein [Pseudomonadota bacterium]